MPALLHIHAQIGLVQVERVGQHVYSTSHSAPPPGNVMIFREPITSGGDTGGDSGVGVTASLAGDMGRSRGPR